MPWRPAWGLNSFFAVVVANIVSLTGLSYLQSFQAALCIILIEGIIFLILSLLNIREKIVDCIPLGVRMGIAPGIGLMLMNIAWVPTWASIRRTAVRSMSCVTSLAP